ncbi:MAG TPA: amidase [Acidimicrobiia bacterium]|nr:amidase [Acidimicrobiia bacterium]
MSESAVRALQRLHDSQDLLNACTLINDAAADAAGAGPLSGLTLAVKDIIDQAGQLTTCGSAFYRDTPAETAPAVARLEEAGGAVLARTGLHEFAYGFSSENPWFGPVRNPWDPETSPGGSSGGSAVAVAAGLVDAAVGTDTGGSIRVPAAMTGIYGLKVTFGRVPTTGVFPLAPSLDTVGPLARDAQTLERMYRVMAGLDPARSTPVPLEGLRIGVPRQWVAGGPTEATVRAAFAAALNRLEQLGAVVVDHDAPDLVPWGMIQELAGAEAAHIHRGFRAAGRPYGEEVAARLDAAAKVTTEDYLESHRWRARLMELFADAFRTVDLLATPAVASRRKVIGQDLIDGKPYRPVLSWFSALVNHAGVPALAVPLTTASSSPGPPPSLQLITPWWQEDLLLATAHRLEGENLVGFTRPPLFAA